jgi:hypothetical protein
VQAFTTTHLHGSYCTYDKIFFWQGQYRKDHGKMQDQIVNAIVAVEALKLELSDALTPMSPAGTPTWILENGFSPNIISRRTQPLGVDHGVDT